MIDEISTRIGELLLWLGQHTKDVEVNRTLQGKWRVGVKVTDKQHEYKVYINGSLRVALNDAFCYVEKDR